MPYREAYAALLILRSLTKGGTTIPTKYEFYAQMADHAAVQLTSSPVLGRLFCRLPLGFLSIRIWISS